ncbi:MAG: hypothetical protein ACTSO7_15655 [Candidatus Heimdallarchaeota archaeon]
MSTTSFCSVTEDINKRLQLIGKTISPVIVKNRIFFIKGCKVTITRDLNLNSKGHPTYPKKIINGKLVKGERKAPTIKNGYMGYVIVDFPGKATATLKKITWFIKQEALGAYQREGMGKIQWLEKREKEHTNKTPKKKKLIIRKGLGYYPKPMITAIKALLLHDFVHTSRHESKIYQEITIHNSFIQEACKNHHENGKVEQNNWLIPIIKKYDHLAALWTRKIPTTATISRYDYENGVIDCKALAEDITAKQHNFRALYNFVYYSKNINRFYESMTYAKNKLRNHLLLAVNLLISDFKKGRIRIKHNKVMIVSQPTRDKEENEKFLSKSMVLKRINMSKKGAKKQTIALQERTVQEENPSAKNRENHLRHDI